MAQPFNIVRDGSRILMAGDLRSDDSGRLCSFFRSLPIGSYGVEARNATLDPDAVTAWIQAVADCLTDEHELVYADSQLAMILEDDERYKHGSSSFSEGNVRFERTSGQIPVVRA